MDRPDNEHWYAVPSVVHDYVEDLESRVAQLREQLAACQERSNARRSRVRSLAELDEFRYPR